MTPGGKLACMPFRPSLHPASWGLIAFIFIVTIAALYLGKTRATPSRYSVCTALAEKTPEQALDYARKWHQQQSASPFPRHCEAYALYRLGRFGEAGAEMALLSHEAAQENPHLSLSLLLQAIASYRQAGQPDIALRLLSDNFTNAPILWSADAKARLLAERASIYNSRKQPLLALQDLDQALTLGAEQSLLLTERARSYLLLAQNKAAEADLNAALALDADNIAARTMLVELKQRPAGK
jgi:tetratricopeptide (TPR) repeat protein